MAGELASAVVDGVRATLHQKLPVFGDPALGIALVVTANHTHTNDVFIYRLDVERWNKKKQKWERLWRKQSRNYTRLTNDKTVATLALLTTCAGAT